MPSSFETVFQRALEINLAKFGAKVSDSRGPATLDIPHDSVIMNISSVMFKAVVVLGFPSDRTIRSAFEGTSIQDGESDVFDIYCDIGNMVCGHVNRCLSRTFRFSGISTPIVLQDDHMTPRLFDFPCTEKITLQASSDGGVKMRLWVFVSSGAQALDFKPTAGENSADSLPDEEITESGELELF